MRAYPMKWHSHGHPAPAAASSSTKTMAAQTPRPLQFYRGNISGQKRCNPRWHTTFDRSSPAIATSPQNGSPRHLLTAPRGTKPPRNSASPQSTGILCAKFPSSPEFSQSTAAAVPTKSHAPAPRPHPPLRICFRRSEEIAFLASSPRAAVPAAPPLADPAMGPAPFHAAPESAQATLRFACRTGTPRQRTPIPARAAPSRLCTHSPAKSSFLLFLTSPRASALSVQLRYLLLFCSLLCALRVLSDLCVKSLPFFPKLSTLNCQLLTAFFPSKVITFPRSFTTPLSAPVGIRIISSNNPVIAVKNSSMLSSRSRVYASPCGLDLTSRTHSASTFSVGSISRRFRSSETIRKISQTSLIDSKWSRRSPSTCTTRTIRHPCSSRRLVLTFERATASVAEISSAGSGCGDRNNRACTCATVRLIPHRVPISPQCKMNFCATGVKLFFVG